MSVHQLLFFHSNNSAIKVIADVYYNFSMNISSETVKESIQMKSRRFLAISVKGMYILEQVFFPL